MKFTPEQQQRITEFDSFLKSLPLETQGEALSELTTEYNCRLPDEVRYPDAGVHHISFRQEDIWTESDRAGNQ